MVPVPGGGCSPWKMYTPARTAPRNPYPHSLAQTLRNPTLTGTKVGPKAIPLLVQIHKKGYPEYCEYCGTTIVKKWLIGIIVGAYHRKFGQFCAIFHILRSPWHNHWKNHNLPGTNLVFKNPTFSGTLLENPTLCGTEVGQNGTLGVLAYEYCRQWECPHGVPVQHWPELYRKKYIS